MSTSSLVLLSLVGFLVAAANGQTAPVRYCGGIPADVIFLIDDSSSIWSEYFRIDVIPFVKNVVEMFDIGPGPNQTRAGVAKFSSSYKLEFYLDDFMVKQALLDRILEIKSEGGDTATGDAIFFASNIMFTQRHGMRPNVAHIMVVLTDGASQDQAKTKRAAWYAKKKGLEIFAIGVGDNVDKEELANIASDPDKEYMFTVGSFSGLDQIKEKLALQTCKTTLPPTTTTTPAPTTTPTTTTTTTPAPTTTGEHAANMQGDMGISIACGGKPADIYFVVDTSSSIVPEDFNHEMLPFMQGVVGNFDIGPGPKQTRVGVVTFSDDYTAVFGLDDYLTKQGLKNALTPDVVRFKEGGTRPDKALRYVREYGLSPDVARPSVAHLVILVTDGMSEDPDATLHEARLAKEQGIYVYAIGVGLADQQELLDMASQPADQFTFNVSDYRSLATIRDLLTIKTCNLSREQNDQPRCDFSSGELVFGFDSSSVGLYGSRQITTVIEQGLRGFYRNPEVKLGMVTGGCEPLGSIPSSSAGDFRRRLVEADDAHGPQLVGALQVLRRKYFRRAPRSTARRKALLFVDRETLEEKQRLRKEILNLGFQRIDVKVVAVGPVDENFVNEMAGGEEDVVHVSSYDALPSAAPKIMDLVC